MKNRYRSCRQKNNNKADWENAYLVEGVLEEQGKKFYNWKLRTRLNPPQVNTDEQTQEICELFQVAVRQKEKKKIENRFIEVI